MTLTQSWGGSTNLERGIGGHSVAPWRCSSGELVVGNAHHIANHSCGNPTELDAIPKPAEGRGRSIAIPKSLWSQPNLNATERDPGVAMDCHSMPTQNQLEARPAPVARGVTALPTPASRGGAAWASSSARSHRQPQRQGREVFHRTKATTVETVAPARAAQARNWLTVRM
jgi:hypothetical protein